MKDLEHQLEQSWITNAEAWTQSVREKQIESRKLVTDQAVIQEIARHRPAKVLDVGCGEGWLVRTLAEKGMEVVGIDGSNELIKRAKESGGGVYYTINYTDFCESPKQVGDQFDAIVCNFSILSEVIVPLLTSLSSLLSQQGVLMIHTLHPFAVTEKERYEDGWRKENFQGMGEGYQAEMPWYFRTMSSWLNALHHAGLRLVHCKEPIHPLTGKPLSLLMTAQKAGLDEG
ncbi:MAG TPA: methyltransferase domain-containing protein [Brevibacillus sp.]|nr:methyltransferase domain-containing protein [Brevibacillus sp.]